MGLEIKTNFNHLLAELFKENKHLNITTAADGLVAQDIDLALPESSRSHHRERLLIGVLETCITLWK